MEKLKLKRKACPNCDINRRKLEAAEQMAKAVRGIYQEHEGCDSYCYFEHREFNALKAALSAWEKAGKGER